MLNDDEIDQVKAALQHFAGHSVTFDFRPNGSVWAVTEGEPDGPQVVCILGPDRPQ